LTYWNGDKWTGSVFDARIFKQQKDAENRVYDRYCAGDLKSEGIALIPLSYGMHPCCIKNVVSDMFLAEDGGWTTNIYKAKMIKGPEEGAALLQVVVGLTKGERNEG
jgi:hypothetical protein